jgi:hypothetical protein
VRRAALVLAGAAALALVAAATAAGQRRDGAAGRSPLATVESAGPRGLAAARAFLAATGRDVARRAGDEAAPSPGAVVILAAPRAELDGPSADALLAHVRAGGTLLWALGPAPQPALSRALGVRASAAPPGRTAVPLSPHPLLRGLALPAGPAALASTAPGALAAAGTGDAVAVVAIPVGVGEALVLGGPDALENARAAEGGTATLLARLAARGPVVFDERFLARPAAPARGAPAGLAVAVAQALAVALVALLAAGRRLGAVRPPPPAAERRTSRDYLASLARLYRRAGAEDALAAAAWRGLRRRLERAGIPPRLADADAARRLAPRAPAAARALEAGAGALARGGPGVLLAVSRAAAEVDAAVAGRRR